MAKGKGKTQGSQKPQSRRDSDSMFSGMKKAAKDMRRDKKGK